MQLSSPTFTSSSPLPATYTCKGKGISPPLDISDVPVGAASLALIMHDPDTPSGHDFLHWSVWNIDPRTVHIPEGGLPTGAVQGTNDFPSTTYGPACPPAGSGTHRYIFDLYALDTTLELPEGANRKQLESALSGHTLATTQLVGVVAS